jgi:hypothetical protein
MGPQIKEADWKIFREIRVTALERFCERILSGVSRLAAETGQSSHRRYLAVFRLLQEQDDQLADMFNNPRRSAALFQLARMRSQGLLTEEEFACFSSETRSKAQFLLGSAD